MGIPTSEVGYTPAMPRREDHKVHKDMWWHWTHTHTKKTFILSQHRMVPRYGKYKISGQLLYIWNTLCEGKA